MSVIDTRIDAVTALIDAAVACPTSPDRWNRLAIHLTSMQRSTMMAISDTAVAQLAANSALSTPLWQRLYTLSQLNRTVVNDASVTLAGRLWNELVEFVEVAYDVHRELGGLSCGTPVIDSPLSPRLSPTKRVK
jgi:hypothetical protein